MSPDDHSPTGTSRRGFLLAGVGAGVAGVVAGAAAGLAVGGSSTGTDGEPRGDSRPTTIEPGGAHQAGVDRPEVLQRHLALSVLDVEAARLADLLDAVGARIADLATGADPALAGLDPSRLTVTVGVGGRVLAALGLEAPATELPAFRRDEIPDERTGGDLLLLCRADDGAVASLARSTLCGVVGGTERWRSDGFTSAPDGPATRNLIGFHDGLSIPRTPTELQESVWVPEGPFADGTVAVIRVMPIDTAAIESLAVPDQERLVGRKRSSGAPLSGGSALDDPDLHAKSASGVPDIPVDAHVRRAHPLPAGLDGLMLRRSYSYSAGPEDQGAVFVSFQRDREFFVRTQQRLDEGDALLDLTRTTASAAFVVLPGFTAERPLGSALRA
ncbi:Dyp-type peroxidase [Agromyces sp. NPDC058110]|uniref:Dyp-type peroxidase n=1 Tax=Agromyces sp. NPDC058110 TaxID=3346345 RepID=UPI0036DB2A7C